MKLCIHEQYIGDKLMWNKTDSYAHLHYSTSSITLTNSPKPLCSLLNLSWNEPRSPSNRFLLIWSDFVYLFASIHFIWRIIILSASCVALPLPNTDMLDRSSLNCSLRGCMTTVRWQLCLVANFLHSPITRSWYWNLSNLAFELFSIWLPIMNCMLSIRTCWTPSCLTEYSIVCNTFLNDSSPWNVRKCNGSFSNSFAQRLNSSMLSATDLPASCVSILFRKTTFFNSKLPHNVRTPCIHRSNEYSARNVVLPQPVGPALQLDEKESSVLNVWEHTHSCDWNELTGKYCQFAWSMTFQNSI